MRSPRATATRRTILEVARSCFADGGFAATSTRQIAKQAGVTQPLVHHYFGTKEALFDEVVDDAIAQYDELQNEQWQLPMGDLRFWTAGLTVLFRWLGEHQELLRLGTWARLEGRARYREGAVEVFARVRRRLAFAQKSGVLREDVDVDVAIVMIDALFKGYWDRRALLEQYPVDPDGFDARFLDQSLRTLLLGMLCEEAADEALRLLRG